MSHHQIAVVITTFNSDQFIIETVASVRAQTLQPAEIVVIDNGSTDKTEELVNSMGIPFFVQTEGRVGTSRNLGLAKTASPLIKFLDGDDLLLPDALEILCDGLESSQAPYVYGKSNNFTDVTYATTAATNIAHSDVPIASPTVLNSLMQRSIFETFGLPEEDNHSWNRWFSTAQSHGLIAHIVDAHVGLRRIHGANVSLQEDAKSEVFRLLAERIKQNRAKNEA